MKFVLVAAILSLFVVNPSADVQSCRALYFSEPTEEQATSLQERASKIKGNDALKQAYLGTAKSMLAAYGFNPFSKFNMFKSGTNMIEGAVEIAPKDAEIRVLRLGVQLNAPAFLLYNSDLEADIDLIIEALNNNAFADDLNYRNKVVTFLSDKAPLNEKQQKQISALK